MAGAIALGRAEGVFTTVGHVKEAILVLVLFVDCRHQRGSWWQGVLHKDKDGLLWAQLDSLPHHIDKLADSEISRDKVLLLINLGDISFASFLNNHRNSVGILIPDPGRFGLPFLCNSK